MIELDPVSGERRTVAEKLPIGLQSKRPGMAPAYLPTGVAVSGDGTVFVSAARDQALLRIRPKT